jgi:heme A synthase
MSETKTAAHTAAETREVRVARLRLTSLGVVVMLILQFILGMIYNLYGTAPTSTKSIGLFSGPVIALHVILGILLFVAAVVLLVRAIQARHKLSIWLSAIGLLSILGAGFAGLGFAGSGANSASLGMALAFAVALACYIGLVSALAPSGRAAPEQASTT